MCGIIGIMSKGKINLNTFEKSLNTLYHRGPDGFGIWNEDGIALGHRRLSILDLSERGKQPMEYLDRYVITFNGEIYNFLEIRKELEDKGYKFNSDSDTEVVLASYIEWKEKCLLKFNGMWALAIWDKKDKELFLSRDRFGKKPLFYSKNENDFVFASEMKAIYPYLKEVTPSKEFNWMSQNIFLYEGTDKCLIEGIKRFPAGNYGIYKNGNLKIVRYWNTLDHLVKPSVKYEDQVKEFRELFIDACRIRMRSDVSIGTALSGGLDSSATISTMAYIAKKSNDISLNKDWQHAFVATFPGTPLDETYYAKKVVENINIGATYIEINPLDHWDNIYEYFYQFEDLYLTSPIPMLETYKSVKDHGVTVTLDGHGADELFSGYGHLLEALWDCGLNIFRIKDIISTYKGTIEEFPQDKVPSDAKIYFSFMLRKLIRKVRRKEYKSIDANHKNYKKLDNFTKQLYIIFHETILPTLLRNYDRYSMMNSVEIRMPFMDYRLVCYVFSLSASSKFGYGYTKRLIRDAVQPFMPDEVTYRKSKIGFNSPILDWMQGELKPWFKETIESVEFKNSKLIKNHQVLKTRISNILEGKNNSFSEAVECWKELVPYIWEKSLKLYKENE